MTETETLLKRYRTMPDPISYGGTDCPCPTCTSRRNERREIHNRIREIELQTWDKPHAT